MNFTVLTKHSPSNLLNKPEEYLGHASKAAYEQLRIEDAEYAEKIEKIIIRVAQTSGQRSTPQTGLKKHGQTNPSRRHRRPRNTSSPHGTASIFQMQTLRNSKQSRTNRSIPQSPSDLCMAPDCGKDGPFEFSQEESTFIDSQDLRLQEKPEDLPPGQLPRTLAVKLIGDEIVDFARPGDHVSIVGVVRAFAPSLMGMGKLRTFILQLEANSRRSFRQRTRNLTPIT